MSFTIATGPTINASLRAANAFSAGSQCLTADIIPYSLDVRRTAKGALRPMVRSVSPQRFARTRRPSIALTAVSLSVALLLSACGATSGSASAAPKTFSVGYIVPLTGATSSLGTATEQGWNTAVGVFGSKVDGITINTHFVDDAGSVTTGQSAAVQLVSVDHVSLIEGPILANVDAAVANYLGPLHVPFVDLCACSAVQIQTYKKYGNAFASSSTADQTSTFAAQYMRQADHYNNITIVAMNYAFGWEVVGSFIKEFTELGGTIKKIIWVPINAVDLSPYVSQIATSSGAVALQALGSLGVTFLRDYSTFGLKVPLFGITGLTTDQASLPAEPASLVTGLVSASWYCDGSTNSANTRFVSAFERRYHAVPGYYSEAAYAKYQELIDAVRSLHGKKLAPHAILEAAKAAVAQISSPRGRASINSVTASPTQNIFFCKVEPVKGVLRNVQIASTQSVPPWGLLSYNTWWALFQYDSVAQPNG